MASSFFDHNNSFWQWLAGVVDVFGLSLCWLLCSLPLLTVGAATAALYDGVYHGLRRGEGRVYPRFFRTFVRELLPATLASLPFAGAGLLCALLFHVTQTMAAAGNGAAAVLVWAYGLLFSLPLGSWLLTMALLSRFRLRTGQLLSAALRLSLARLPVLLALSLLTVAGLRLMGWWYVSMSFLPALLLWGASFCFEPIFRPWLEQEAG